MSIHNFEVQIERVMKRVQKAEILEENRQLLLEYADQVVLEGLSVSRRIRILQYLMTVSKDFNKDLATITEKELKKYVSNLQQSSYAAWTKKTYKVILRKFFRWVAKERGKELNLDWISIRVSRCDLKTKGVGDILDQNEVLAMIQKADNVRDKALIALYYESGARAGEIGNAYIKDVHFDEYGILFNLHGKTGTRTARLIWSVPYLSNWLNVHPFQADPESHLWINTSWKDKNRHLKYPAIRKIFGICAKRAGIKKRVHPHLFRHSRASHLARHLTEFQMNQYFGWIQGSKMAATYVHMNAKNVDDAILALNGVKSEERVIEEMPKAKECPRCDTLNTPEDKCCTKCGGILDIRYAAQLQEIKEQEEASRSRNDKLMNVLLQDKNVQELLLEKLTKLGSDGSLL